MTSGDDDVRGATTLSGLVRARRAELGLSLRAFCDDAVDPLTLEQIKRGWLDRLESREPVIPPRLPTLRALAAALQLPLSQIQTVAAEEFFGIRCDWSMSDEVQRLVLLFERLAPEQGRVMLDLLAAFPSPGTSGEVTHNDG